MPSFLKIRDFVRVLLNYGRTHVWARAVWYGLRTYSESAALAALTGGMPWNEFWLEFKRDFPSRFFYSPRNQKDFFKPCRQCNPMKKFSMTRMMRQRGRSIFSARVRLTYRCRSIGVKISNPVHDGTTGFIRMPDLWEPAQNPDLKIPWSLAGFNSLHGLGKGTG